MQKNSHSFFNRDKVRPQQLRISDDVSFREAAAYVDVAQTARNYARAPMLSQNLVQSGSINFPQENIFSQIKTSRGKKNYNLTPICLSGESFITPPMKHPSNGNDSNLCVSVAYQSATTPNIYNFLYGNQIVDLKNGIEVMELVTLLQQEKDTETIEKINK